MNGKKKVLPNQLRYFRKLGGYKQQDVAFLLGIKGTARISEWEAGIANPSHENLIKLSIIYQRLPDSLYHELRKKCVQEIEDRKRQLHELCLCGQVKDKGG